MMKFVLGLLSLLLCAQAHAEPVKNGSVDAVEWKEQSPSKFKGKSELAASNPTVEYGGFVSLAVRFSNMDDAFPAPTFLNPFLQQRDSLLPAMLAVFDKKHKYVGDLIESAEGIMPYNTIGDWISIPAGCSIETRVNAQVGGPYLFVPAGTYYLQLIYNRSFITPRPRSEKEIRTSKQSRGELFRSNIVKIELVDKRATQ